MEQILIKQATKDGYIPCRIGGVADLTYPASKTRRGRVIMNGTVSPTITCNENVSVLENWTWSIDGKKYRIRIRRLSAKETWRLMGFKDEDYEKAAAVCSKSQLYKQAGNSIVKQVLEAIFKEMLPDKTPKERCMELLDSL